MNEDSDDFGNVSRNLRGCFPVALGMFLAILAFLLV